MQLPTINNSSIRSVGFCLLVLIVVAWANLCPAPAVALVVQDMTGTTVAPADDPGWDFVTGSGDRAYVYLGNGWALSAFHVGVPGSSETLHFGSGSYSAISNQAYVVPNPTGVAGITTADTDLRLIRINGDPGTPNFSIPTQQLTESTPETQREVVIIGAGPSRQQQQTQWTVTPVAGANNDVWTVVTSGGSQVGYKSIVPDDDVKRWGTNRIADEDTLVGGSDNDLRFPLQLQLGVGQRDVMSMVTRFDAPGQGGITNEAQAVSGDSGSAVFYKRNGQWELVGIVNATYSTVENQNNSYAVYGNYTTFADLQFYRSQIQAIINNHPYNALSGDINLDGMIRGDGTGPVATDDVSAFVTGWLYDNGTGAGSYGSWLKGDLNGDGKTNIADFFLLRSALNSAGSGAGLSLASLNVSGVPEPSGLLLAMAGAAAVAAWRGRRRRRAAV